MTLMKRGWLLKSIPYSIPKRGKITCIEISGEIMERDDTLTEREVEWECQFYGNTISTLHLEYVDFQNIAYYPGKLSSRTSYRAYIMS